MTPTLRRKLEALAERREELERMLADPAVIGDAARFRRYSREFAQLEPVATALAAEAQRSLSAEGVDNAAVLMGPLAAGDARHAPFDVITLQGGVETIPDSLLAQIKEGGRIGAIFMEGALGSARVGYKIDGVITWRFVFNATAPVLPGFTAKRGFTL